MSAEIDKIFLRVTEISKQLRVLNDALTEYEAVRAAYRTPDIKEMKKNFDKNHKKVK